MQQRYGDPETAAIAYNMGPEKTDMWIANGRNLSDLPLETLKYLKNYKANVTKAAPPPAAAPSSTPALDAQVDPSRVSPVFPLPQQQPGAAPAQAAAPPPSDFQAIPSNPLSELGRQLGLTARDVGHGVAAGAGALTQGFTRLMGVPDVQDVINRFVNDHTPQPNPGLEQGINDVASTMANPLNYLPGMQGGGLARNVAQGAVVAGMQPTPQGTTPLQVAGNVAGGAIGGGLVGGLGAGGRGGRRRTTGER